jgi:hypothetical protein
MPLWQTRKNVKRAVIVLATTHPSLLRHEVLLGHHEVIDHLETISTQVTTHQSHLNSGHALHLSTKPISKISSMSVLPCSELQHLGHPWQPRQFLPCPDRVPRSLWRRRAAALRAAQVAAKGQGSLPLCSMSLKRHTRLCLGQILLPAVTTPQRVPRPTQSTKIEEFLRPRNTCHHLQTLRVRLREHHHIHTLPSYLDHRYLLSLHVQRQERPRIRTLLSRLGPPRPSEHIRPLRPKDIYTQFSLPPKQPCRQVHLHSNMATPRMRSLDRTRSHLARDHDPSPDCMTGILSATCRSWTFARRA